MILKKILITFTCFIVVLGLAACSDPVDIDNRDGGEPETQDYPVIVNEVTISSKPTKVAVISPSIADAIIALDYEASLALATVDCTQPQLVDLEKVSIDDYQAFTDAEIDLIITDSIDVVHKDSFTQMNIPVLVISPAVDRTDFDRMYSQIGSALNGANTGLNEGITEARSIYTTLDDIQRVIPESDTIITAAFLLDTTSSAITGDTIGDDLMTSAGLTNIFKGSLDYNYSMEELGIANPQYIFCLEGMKAEIMSSSKFSGLNAVINDNVYELPASNILWLGRSVITGASTMAGIVYPQLLDNQNTDPDAPDVMTPDEESSDSSVEEIPNAESSATEEGSSETESSAQESSESESSTEDTGAPGEHDDSGEYKWLRVEDQGEEVYNMQNRLKELGYLTVEFNGYYGDKTVEAIKLFQRNTGLEQTGEADPNTLAYLFDENAVSNISG